MRLLSYYDISVDMDRHNAQQGGNNYRTRIASINELLNEVAQPNTGSGNGTSTSQPVVTTQTQPYPVTHFPLQPHQFPVPSFPTQPQPYPVPPFASQPQSVPLVPAPPQPQLSHIFPFTPYQPHPFLSHPSDTRKRPGAFLTPLHLNNEPKRRRLPYPSPNPVYQTSSSNSESYPAPVSPNPRPQAGPSYRPILPNNQRMFPTPLGPNASAEEKRFARDALLYRLITGTTTPGEEECLRRCRRVDGALTSYEPIFINFPVFQRSTFEADIRRVQALDSNSPEFSKAIMRSLYEASQRFAATSPEFTETMNPAPQWTVPELNRLVSISKLYHFRWNDIARQFPGRSTHSCQLKYNMMMSRRNVRKNAWPLEEVELLKRIYNEENGNLKEVAKRMPGRGYEAIRKRWFKIKDTVAYSSWSPEEDKQLEDLTLKFGRSYELIASKFPGKSVADVKVRISHMTKHSTALSHMIANRWKAEEDRKIMDLVERHGIENIEDHLNEVPGRSAAAFLTRFRTLFPNSEHLSNRGSRWTPQEDQRLANLVAVFGHDWSEIEKSFPNRSRNAVKNRWLISDFNTTLNHPE